MNAGRVRSTEPSSRRRAIHHSADVVAPECLRLFHCIQVRVGRLRRGLHHHLRTAKPLHNDVALNHVDRGIAHARPFEQRAELLAHDFTIHRVCLRIRRLRIAPAVGAGSAISPSRAPGVTVVRDRRYAARRQRTGHHQQRQRKLRHGNSVLRGDRERLLEARQQATLSGVPPLIISASRRTDIPAFFSTWWMHRVREGQVLVRNPRNPRHVMEVSLLPDDVLAVVYWSRDYGRLIPHLPELDERGLRPCFHLTLTGYGPPLELRGPPEQVVLKQFEQLAARYGPDRTVWRYDPIVLGSRHSRTFHENQFARLAKSLAPFVRRCVISFLDPYPSTRRELASIEAKGIERFDSPPSEMRRRLAANLVALGLDFGIVVNACCESDIADVVAPARCIDADWIRSFAPADDVAFRPMATRKGCGCVFARDVGAYHTCGHGCVYCYANESMETALRNASAVQPQSNHLGTGTLTPQAPEKKKTYDSGQLSLGNLSDARAYQEQKSRR